MKVEIKYIQIIVSLTGIAFLIIHLIFPSLNIDTTTVLLIVIVFLPWLAPIIKSLELNGIGKVEFHESKLHEITKDAIDSDLANPKSVVEYPQYDFEVIRDPNLALASLRLEIEKILRNIVIKNNFEGNSLRHSGIKQLLRILKERNILTHPQVSVIEEMTTILNSAVHGVEVSESARSWAINIGPQILNSLKDILETSKGK